MTREHYLARLLRALSGKTQEQMAEETGVHPSLIGQIEQGQVLPAADHLARMAQSLGLTVRDAEEVLALAETLQRAQLRRGPGAEELLEDIARQVRELVQAAYRRILTLPLPESPPKPEDRLRAADLWARLEALEPHLWSAAIQISEELQSWALCEQVCAEAMRATARDAGQAVALGRLAREIAERVRGAEGWRNALRGYAAAHAAYALWTHGELAAARATFEEARGFWQAGADPGRLLDAGKMLHIDSCLHRRPGRDLDPVGRAYLNLPAGRV